MPTRIVSASNSPGFSGGVRSDSNHGLRGRWNDSMLRPETPEVATEDTRQRYGFITRLVV